MTVTERPLPFDERAEKAVLGLILCNPKALDEVASLRVDDFLLPAHRTIFEGILDLDARGKPIEVIALSNLLEIQGTASRLPDGVLYLLHLANCAEVGEPSYFAGLVTEKAVLRRMIGACAEIGSRCYGDVGDVSEFLGDARRRLTSIETPTTSAGPVLLRDDLEGALTEVESRAANPGKHFVLTGIQAFDREISGLCAKMLILIAGRPSKGKSALLFNCALRAARNRVPSLVFSLEMARLLLVIRALSFESMVNGQSISSGRLSPPEWIRLQSAASRLSGDTVWIEDRSLSRHEIKSEARRWRDDNPSEQAEILIDYLGRVKKSGAAASGQEEIADITGDMTELAKELELPVVLAAQLNRDSEMENRRPKLKDLRGSGAIEQDADVVIFPWWDGPSPRYGRHPASLIVEKNRNGPTAEIPVDWLPEYTMFADREDLAEPQQRSFA